MVALIPVPDRSMNFMSEVRGVPEYQGDRAFDSKFSRSRCPTENSTLQITLRMFLKQVTPSTVNMFIVQNLAKLFDAPLTSGIGAAPDWDSKPNLIKPWGAGDWYRFVKGFTRQAMMWHNKFWLIPPSDFTLFDLHERAAKFRPNIFCAFNLKVVHTTADAHQTIEVVNLHNPAIDFRSDSSHYSSNDTKLAPTLGYDAANRMRQNKQPTIAHEVGHAIGLPHIGESRGLQACSNAKLVYEYKDYIKQDWLAAIYQGGIGASVCYGDRGSFGDIDNIMGMGSKFAKENASPWLDRLAVHLNGKMDKSKWTVSLSKILPKKL